MALSGLHTFSFFDNGDDAGTTTAGTVVQMNNIKQDQGELRIQRPLEDQRNPLDEVVYAGEENFVELAVYDDNVLSQLQAWQKANRRIQAVAAGFQENLLWYHPTTVRVLPKNHLAAGSRSMRIVRINASAAGLPIAMSVNMLIGASVEGETSPSLLFPISNIDVTLGVDASTTGTVTLETVDYDGSVLQSKSISLVQGSRQSTNLTTQTSTYKTKMNGLGQTTNESLRTDGEEDYIGE